MVQPAQLKVNDALKLMLTSLQVSMLAPVHQARQNTCKFGTFLQKNLTFLYDTFYFFSLVTALC